MYHFQLGFGLKAFGAAAKLAVIPTSGKGTTRAPTEPSKPSIEDRPTVTARERLSFCEDDFIDIGPDERSLAAADTLYLQHTPDNLVAIAQDTPRSLLGRSRKSISRLKSLRRRTLPQRQPKRRANSAPLPIDDESALIFAFPRPPTTSATSDTVLAAAIKRANTVPSDNSTSLFFDSDPFQRAAPKPPTSRSVSSPTSQSREEILDSDCIITSPATNSTAPSTTNPLLQSLRNLNIIRKSLCPTAPDIREIFEPEEADYEEDVVVAHSPLAHFLPELSFDSTPLSLIVSECALALAEESHEALCSQSPALSESSLDEEHPGPRFPLLKWECVDPLTLTTSPASSNAFDFSPEATPLLIPSPSWLSRNTRHIEHCVTESTLRILIEPSSPPPLPIIPRSSQFHFPGDTSDEDIAVLEPSDLNIALRTPRSAGSSVTLCSPTQRLSHLSRRTPRSRTSSIHRLSIVQYRRSIIDNRRSVHSFVTYSFPCNQDSPLPSPSQDYPQPQFYLLLHPQSPEEPSSELIPSPSPLPLPLPLSLDLFGSGQNNSTYSDQQLSPLRLLPPSPTSYQVFIPSPDAYAQSKDVFPLPNYLRAFIKNIHRNSKNIPTMPMNLYGKQADTVDWGDEVDYSGYEWFKDPPPKPERAPTPPPVEPYIPQPGVIEQNEVFDYALKSAPNVLYSRYKQYGQLGVLAWCSEFSEMVDALKTLGFEGNMFVSTRAQALKACDDILKLDLDIEMQIIVMYLSSQVARLRRFLDADKQFEDYPLPKFPMDPHIQYGS